MTNLQATLPVPPILIQIAAMLAGPVIWIVFFLVVYAVGEFGCLSGALDYAIGGIHVITLITAALGLVAMVGLGVVGWRAYQRWRSLNAMDAASESRRTRFVTFGAVLLTGLFELAILLSIVPVLVLHPCRP